ncbi:umecyanin-like [Canna indica]|uniref:Umecyanin-like n=1 Tax=Canna indica TaxID=4628 RepID=A0AAQ3KVD5_9LILI|nr:umecyanin-like [Canna indica]
MLVFRINWLIRILAAAIILFITTHHSLAHQEHLVGDSIWSIPTSNAFYSNWANNRSFTVGDTLVFRFEMGFYDVVQVSRREFDDCTAGNPFRSFDVGPASVRLNEEAMHYFICSFGNYCLLGMKLPVPAHRLQPPPINSSPDSPLPPT